MPFGGPFTLEKLPRVDTTKLRDDEVAQIERTVIESQDRIAELSVERLELRTERDAFEHRVSELQDRIRQLEADRPSLEPREVLADFGEAVGGVGAELEGGYAISDLEVDLKANVVRTSEGLRVHLPTLDEEFATENLSNLRFRVSRRRDESETALEEVPDVRYLDVDTARERVRAAGFDVAVEYEVAPDEEPGIVLAQFPSPYSLTEPTTEVALTVSTGEDEADEGGAIEETELDAGAEPPQEEPPAEEGTEGGTSQEATGAEPTREREPERGERLDPEVVSGIGPTVAERLREADVATVEAVAATEPERIAATADLAVADAERIVDRSLEHLRARMPGTASDLAPGTLTAAEPAEAERLRDAGFSTVEAVGSADPGTIADAADLPVERAERLSRDGFAYLLAGADERDLPALEDVSGIGPTYARRLRNAGVDSVAELARLPAEKAASIAETSTSRAAPWIAQSREMLAGRA